MKLTVIALDYDGTIADAAGKLDASVREAILQLRASHISVLIVTGRRIEHLREGIGDLRIVDAIVAENGALVVFPSSGRTLFLGRRPPPPFLDALKKSGVDFIAGDCVLEMAARDAAMALSVIQRMELPLVLLFNRNRVMVLPQSVSKGTGLQEALTAMRLSVHNTIAIGDAENDHEMLSIAEVGAAVAWGSSALRNVADEVIQGDGAPAVAPYLRGIAARPLIGSRAPSRRPLILGRAAEGHSVLLDVGSGNLIISGDPRSGKSWIAGLLAEQLVIQRYSVCLIDPEGDYRGLETLPGVLLFGGDDPPARPRELMQAFRNADFSTVIDLSKLAFDEKREYVGQLLQMLQIVRWETGLPHRIVIDEAHYFIDAANAERLDLSLGGATLVTYRLSDLPPNVIKATAAVIATRHTDPHEVETIRKIAAKVPPEDLGRLRMDQAILVENSHYTAFQIAPRITYHVRHQHKYLDVPVSDRQAFVFRQPGLRARSFREFSEILATQRAEVLGEYLKKHDFSQWIANVFGDHPLAAQVRDVERRYQLQPMPDVNDELLRLIRDRYACEGEERPSPAALVRE